MESKELRIGNYLYNGEGYVAVDEIYKDDIKISILKDSPAMFEVCDIQPIPLTEEWLEKFGFEKVIYASESTGYGCEYILKVGNRDKDGFTLNGFTLIYQDDFSLGIYCKEDDGDFITPDLSRFKYVHQLQNLYFALTGEELTIK